MGSWLLGSFGHWDPIEPDFPAPTLWHLIYVFISFGYWNQSVNGIILGLAQNDPIKQRGVYCIQTRSSCNACSASCVPQ
jgi:hypothetical protein